MSLITVLTKKPPSFGKGGNESITFDAVLSDAIDASVQFTQFPVEVGGLASDHGIITPILYKITAGVSNNPIGTAATDFIGGLASNLFDDSPVGALIAGASAGFLAGSNDTRAGSTLQFLFGLMYLREPFDVDAGDVQLTNMVITNIYRERAPETEGGLIFTAELQELALISTAISNQQPGVSKLPGGDPAKTAAAAKVSKGEVFGIPVPASVQSAIGRVFPGVVP